MMNCLYCPTFDTMEVHCQGIKFKGEKKKTTPQLNAFLKEWSARKEFAGLSLSACSMPKLLRSFEDITT